MDINSFLGKINKDSIKQLGSIVNTPAGQELLKKLKNIDKNELMQRLSSMSEANMPREELLKQLANDPQLINKLNDFLEKQ